MVGTVGQILGDAGINIAGMQVSRDEQRRPGAGRAVRRLRGARRRAGGDPRGHRRRVGARRRPDPARTQAPGTVQETWTGRPRGSRVGSATCRARPRRSARRPRPARARLAERQPDRRTGRGRPPARTLGPAASRTSCLDGPGHQRRATAAPAARTTGSARRRAGRDRQSGQVLRDRGASAALRLARSRRPAVAGARRRRRGRSAPTSCSSGADAEIEAQPGPEDGVSTSCSGQPHPADPAGRPSAVLLRLPGGDRRRTRSAANGRRHRPERRAARPTSDSSTIGTVRRAAPAWPPSRARSSAVQHRAGGVVEVRASR